jgi:hypothetical protein
MLDLEVAENFVARVQVLVKTQPTLALQRLLQRRCLLRISSHTDLAQHLLVSGGRSGSSHESILSVNAQ